MDQVINLLVVDDDSAIRSSLEYMLKRFGFFIETASGPAEAILCVRKKLFQVILLDMNYTKSVSGEEGLELLQRIKVLSPESAVILITAWGSIELAVKGIRLGAFDFVTKPWTNNQLLKTISTAIELSKKSHNYLSGSIKREDLDLKYSFGNIVGNNQKIVSVLEDIARVAGTSAPVLITGESGTGKELFAEAIHNNSRRSSFPFVKVNLGGISNSLFESEMFGHKKGAFTDAVSERKGRFELADGGTIFLDEIGELELLSQVKLLRVLQDQTFEPLGSDKSVSVDVRIICATNKNLNTLVEEGLFREDLLYRINLIHLQIIPLRERLDDVPLLAGKFLEKAAEKYKTDKKTISANGIKWLKEQYWHGNIRELKNLIERSVLMISNSELTDKDFLSIQSSASDSGLLKIKPGISLVSLDEMEMDMIIKTLKKYSSLTKVAEVLGISRATLYRKMKKYGIGHES